MRIEWNKVTWYSKAIALVLFIFLPFLGFYFGAQYGKLQQALQQQDHLPLLSRQSTEQARTVEYAPLQDTKEWKVLQGTGFRVKVPADWYVETVKKVINFHGVFATSFAPGAKGTEGPIGIQIEPERLNGNPFSESVYSYWIDQTKTPIIFKGAKGYFVDDTPRYMHYIVLKDGVVYSIGWGSWNLRPPTASEKDTLDTILSTFEFFDERETEEKQTIAWLVDSWKSLAPKIIPGYPATDTAFYGYPLKMQFIGNGKIIIEYETDFNVHLALLSERGGFSYIDGEIVSSDRTSKWEEWVRNYGDPAATLNLYKFSSTREGSAVYASDWTKVSSGLNGF